MLRKVLIFFVLYFLFFYSSNSYAKIKAGSVEAGFSLGWLLIDEDIGSDDEVFGRFDLGLNFTDNLGLELSLSNSLNSLETVPDVSFYSLSMTLNMFPDSDIHPYILLGAGAGNFNTDIIDNESKFIVNGGMGIKFFVSDHWVLRLDARDYMSTEDTAHNFAGSLGLMTSFDVFTPKAEAVPFIPEKPAIEKEETLQEEEAEKAEVIKPETAVTGEETVRPEVVPEISEKTEPEMISGKEAVVIEPETTVTEEEMVRPEVVPEVIEQLERETAPVVEARGVPRLEEIPDNKIVILHKGAQLLIRFPYRSADIDSYSFDLLLQLISYLSKKEIETVKIVGYSYDYDEPEKAREINNKREIKTRDFILRHSDIPASKLFIARQDKEMYHKFKKLAEDNKKDINRLYIVVSFN